MTGEQAETIAVAALGFIAGEDDRLGRFMSLTGLAPKDVRAGAGDRDFLAGVLEYLLSDERLVIAFAEEAQIAPEVPGAALGVLSAA